MEGELNRKAETGNRKDGRVRKWMLILFILIFITATADC
jgi:hypothetical protein